MRGTSGGILFQQEGVFPHEAEAMALTDAAIRRAEARQKAYRMIEGRGM